MSCRRGTKTIFTLNYGDRCHLAAVKITAPWRHNMQVTTCKKPENNEHHRHCTCMCLPVSNYTTAWLTRLVLFWWNCKGDLLPFSQVFSQVLYPCITVIHVNQKYPEPPSHSGEHLQLKRTSRQTLHIQLAHQNPQREHTTVISRLTWSSCSPDFISLCLNFYYVLHQPSAAADVRRCALMCAAEPRLQREPRWGDEI